MGKVFALVILVLFSGEVCAQADVGTRPPHVAAEDCPTRLVAVARTLEDTRLVAGYCVEHRETFKAALERLLEFPQPVGPRLSLAKENPEFQRVGMQLDFNLYFNVFDSYPPKEGFEKLADLIQRLKVAFRIERVVLVARADHAEVEMGTGDLLRRARLRQVFRYLSVAGVPPSTRTEGREEAPVNADNPEGRAQDRVVQVIVYALRNKSE